MADIDQGEMGAYGFRVKKAETGKSSISMTSYATIVAADGDALPPLLEPTPDPIKASVHISFDRYLSPAFVRREVEEIWTKQWQVACREEDIPNVGDRINYDIVHQSYLIVRVSKTEIKAFYNSCPHRGRRLCNSHGNSTDIRCPFHAWTWRLDGGLEWVPSHQDFPHVDAANYSLHEVRVGRWGGNVFINPDPDAPSLEASLGVLKELYADCPQEDRYTILHIRKKIRCNWKLAQEAFMESYHVVETHWDGMPFFGAAMCQYDDFDDGTAHVHRLASPSIVPDFWVEDSVSPADGVMQYCTAFGMTPPPEGSISTITDARKYVAAERRKQILADTGRDFSAKSTAYMIDMVKCFVFPNHHPWWGEGLPWWYRFTPVGDDPACAMMEVRVLAPTPLNGPVPASATPVDIEFDQKCTEFPEIGVIGNILDQDISSLVEIQKGLHAAKPGKEYVTLARDQESNIQHFHRVYTKVMALD